MCNSSTTIWKIWSCWKKLELKRVPVQKKLLPKKVVGDIRRLLTFKRINFVKVFYNAIKSFKLKNKSTKWEKQTRKVFEVNSRLTFRRMTFWNVLNCAIWVSSEIDFWLDNWAYFKFTLSFFSLIIILLSFLYCELCTGSSCVMQCSGTSPSAGSANVVSNAEEEVRSLSNEVRDLKMRVGQQEKIIDNLKKPTAKHK